MVALVEAAPKIDGYAVHALGLLTDEQAADKKAEINARLDAPPHG